jgi:hypothetical protein
MIGMIGVLFGALGFLANVLIIVLIYVFLTKVFSDIIYKGCQELYTAYRNRRTAYYKSKLEKDPGNKILQDKWRRSNMHLFILGMKSYLVYLMEKHGSFEICPKCHFPHKPDPYSCPNCGYVEDGTFKKVVKYLKDGV